MTIKILGSGCPNCQLLEAQTKKAVEELGLKDIPIEHVYDIDKIIEMGITFTPALAINDEIKLMGRIPPVEELKK
ncbi:MAG: MTH895/ArsE family thioredoxin-like protein [Minisyncoccia bacterium]